jgi:hypothetical protein
MVRLPAEETNGTYDAVPKFKDPSNGDISIPDRKPTDAGARRD